MNKKLRTLGTWGLLFVGVLFCLALVGVSATGPDGAAAAISFIWSVPVMGLIYGRKIFDWKGLKEYGTQEEQKNAIIARAAAFMSEVRSGKILGQKMRGPDADLMGDNPVALIQSDTIKTPDRGYELLFDEVDMRASSSDSFDVLDVSGAATFYQLKPGEEVKLTKIGKAVKTAVGYLRFAGGLNILDDWLRFNKFYLIDRLFEDTVRNWWTQRATIFYGLVAALGAGINEAFATDDITTINNACANIQVDMEAAGYAVDETSQFAIICNPKLRARILKALKTTLETQGVNKQVEFNVSTVINTTKIANTSYYVALPGFKSQRGEWEDLIARAAQRDELHLGTVNVWTGAYNGIIGESKQYKRCALS